MRRLLLVVAVLVSSSALLAQEAPRKRYLVATRVPADRVRVRDMVPRDDLVVENFRSVNGFGAELTEDEVRVLRASRNVEFVEPDPVKRALEISGDAQARNRTGQTIPYGIELVKANQLWNVASGRSLRVGVIDTGIDPEHPDLKEHYRGGRDFVENDDNPADLNGHGTHVAGTIAAIDNAVGVVGVAPNVDIYALRVLGADGSGSTSNVIRAVDWAIENKLHILNLSLGSADASDLEERAFQRAADAGILVFAASGNCFTSCEEFPNGLKNTVDYPAAYPTVVSVGAIDSSSTVASFSQRGPQLAIVAPGVGVLSSSRTGQADISDVTFTDGTFDEADLFTLSPMADVAGDYVFCGLGRPQDIPASVAGKIALISRGETKFGDKVRNVMAAGATAAVIFNNLPLSDPNGGTINGTLCRDSNTSNQCINQEDLNFQWILSISISKEDGEALVGTNRGRIVVSARPDDYRELSGTSMAAPHAAGVAALVWSVTPGATAAEVKEAILSTTVDLGAAGFDDTFGRGRIDALAAAQKLAPERFVNEPRKVRGRR